MIETKIIRTVIKQFPAIVPMLTGRARWIAFIDRLTGYKSYDELLNKLSDLIEKAINQEIGTVDFVDEMTSIISGQIRNAYNTAWINVGMDEEQTSATLPDYLETAMDESIMVNADTELIYNFYNDIQSAVTIDGLFSRAGLWANRWTEAYNAAVLLIKADNGENLIWTLGATEEHCPECASLNGIVARAIDWQELDVHPQGAPNDALTCGGWRCDCTLEPTDKRRSANAYNRIAKITGSE